MPKLDTKYLQNRNGYWHFVKRIPDNGRYVRRKTGTKILKEAQEKRTSFLKEMEEALGRTEQIRDIASIRQQYLESSEESREVLEEEILDETEQIAADLGVLDAFKGWKDPDQFSEKDQFPIDYVKKRTGKLTPFAELKDLWLDSIENPRTRTDYRHALEILMEYFSCVEELDWEKCDRFLKTIGAKKNVQSATVEKWMSAYYNFWNWAGKSTDVWRNHKIPQSKKQILLPWTDSDIALLFNTLRQRNDVTASWLKHAVWIAAHTGARQGAIAELVYYPDNQTILFPAKKTEEEDRIIPAHPAIRDNLSAWVKNPKIKFTISNRFTEFKKELGFGEDKNFHSFRRTMITKMENLGAPENVTADIVGHRKGTITYGLYSGGSSLEKMREYLFKIKYSLT